MVERLVLMITVLTKSVLWVVLTEGNVLERTSSLREFEGSRHASHLDENLPNMALMVGTEDFLKTRRSTLESTKDASTNAPKVTGPSTQRDHDPLTDSALNIPGVAGIDYPIFHEVPLTDFDCQKQRYKGFFADISTNCQAWHYCDFSDGQSSFLCPNGTVFSQVLLTCDWWFNVNCHDVQQLYVLNERLYRLVKHPKPTFPEDFHGPEVDLWLKRQLILGTLPKMKRKYA